jgi:hypothetical protein
MDSYKFLGTPLKVHYVIAIQKLSMKFIQCDYIIYNIVLLSPFSSYSTIFNHMAITNFKILQKLPCDNILWRV